MKALIKSLLLASGAGLMTYNFIIILARGAVYPIPNFPIFVIAQMIIFLIIFWAVLGVVESKKLEQGRFLNISLFSLAGSFLFAYIISPWVHIAQGGTIVSYSGREPNLTVAVIELILMAAVAGFGLVNFCAKLKSRWS